MTADEHRWQIFLEVHSGLPREGPGDRASTARALRLAGALPPNPLVVDVGCGPGAQTLDLADLIPDARIAAFDRHEPYVGELRRRAAAAGHAARIDARSGDMRALPLAERSVDLIWCEGAAYFLGIPEALRVWKPLLKPGGRVALTEPVWLQPNPPPDALANWLEYPAMTDVPGNRAIVTRAGFTLLGDFTLPEAAWLNDYYGPLEAHARALAPRYALDPIAQAVLRDVAAEVDAYRKYSAYFGYQFFVMAN
jgi:SAM-dependent methyltransferase